MLDENFYFEIKRGRLPKFVVTAEVSLEFEVK